MCKEGVIINLALHMLYSAVFAFGLDHVTMVLIMRAFFKRSIMSNFNGHLLFQADRLSCSYLNPPGGTNFTLPV